MLKGDWTTLSPLWTYTKVLQVDPTSLPKPTLSYACTVATYPFLFHFIFSCILSYKHKRILGYPAPLPFNLVFIKFEEESR